jgi:hypothetical protein
MHITCPSCGSAVDTLNGNTTQREELQAFFQRLKYLRDTSPTFRLDIDELAEEIWPEINQKS